MLNKNPSHRPNIQQLIRMFDINLSTIGISIIKNIGSLERNRSIKHLDKKYSKLRLLNNIENRKNHFRNRSFSFETKFENIYKNKDNQEKISTMDKNLK